MLTRAQMEDVLGIIDRRLTTIEQILPTLATKQDLERFATKEDLRQLETRFEARFATKQDLERFATSEDLRKGIAEAKQHTNVLFEALVDRIGVLAEAVSSVQADVRSIAKTTASLVTKADDTSEQLRGLVRQLRRKGVI